MADTFTFDDLKEILTGRVGMEPEDVPDDPNTTFEASEVDSLAILEIQAEVEQRYGFEVSQDEAATIKTFADVVDYVQRKMAEAA